MYSKYGMGVVKYVRYQVDFTNISITFNFDCEKNIVLFVPKCEWKLERIKNLSTITKITISRSFETF